MRRPLLYNKIGAFVLAVLFGFMAAGCDSGPPGDAGATPAQAPSAAPATPPPKPREVKAALPDVPLPKPFALEALRTVTEPQPPPLSGKYYVMKGRKYYLLASSRGYVKDGEASWYGKRFHGRKTSSGARYNMHDLTAAHRTLPFGTWVRVVNLENSREVTVRINDRGPFQGANRIIDLSYAAAKAVGMIKPGKARVRVEALGSSDNPAAFSGLVAGVPSGDTLEVQHGDRTVTVRLRGVDCPEMDQPWGDRARRFTADLTVGKEVRIKGGGQDRDGVIEAEVYLPDGRRLGLELIKAGLAWWYREYEGQGRLLATVHLEAQYACAGLWADANPVPPWEWRRQGSEMFQARSAAPGGSDVIKGLIK